MNLAVVAGLGRIAWKLEDDPLREKPATHTGAILAKPLLKLAGGMDQDPEAREAYAKRFGVPVFDNLPRMLSEINPSLLVIATHPDSHTRLLSQGIDAGVPVIVCEKPLALPKARVEPLLRRAEKRGIKVLVNHERRYSLDWQAARSLVQEKKLGEPTGFYARIAMGLTRDPAKVLLWDGTHMLDALRFVLGGEWKLVSRWKSGKPLSQLGAVLNVGGVTGSLEVASGSDHLVFELEIRFTSGRLRVGNGLWEVWESRESPFYSGFKSLVRTEEKTWGQTGYFSGMMHDAALCLQPDHVPASTGWDGLEVLKMIRKIQGI